MTGDGTSTIPSRVPIGSVTRTPSTTCAVKPPVPSVSWSTTVSPSPDARTARSTREPSVVRYVPPSLRPARAVVPKRTNTPREERASSPLGGCQEPRHHPSLSRPRNTVKVVRPTEPLLPPIVPATPCSTPSTVAPSPTTPPTSSSTTPSTSS